MNAKKKKKKFCWMNFDYSYSCIKRVFVIISGIRIVHQNGTRSGVNCMTYAYRTCLKVWGSNVTVTVNVGCVCTVKFWHSRAQNTGMQ